MSDLFYEIFPDEWIDQVFAVMALCPQHTFQVLTKRAARMRDYISARPQPIWDRQALAIRPKALEQLKALPWPLPNVWLGVSTERQQEADERIPLLLQTPAAVRFISAEPLLGAIDLTDIVTKDGICEVHRNALECDVAIEDDEEWKGATLDWVIAGGESGPGARPMHPDWARSLRDQCKAASVPFFFKQWGSWARWEPRFLATKINYFGSDGSSATNPGIDREPMVNVGKAKAGRLLAGTEHNAMPGQPA